MKHFFLILLSVLGLGLGSAEGASIITVPVTPAPNQWMVFRKTIDVAGDPSDNTLRIAADSKYWLYVNGQREVYEGQLKRGPNPKDTYIDYVHLRHLKKGSNTIAVLVWYYGKHGFSHRNSNTGGLYFDLAVGKRHYGSDKSWKAALHPAYYTPAGDVPNFRLPESNIGFDARKDIPDYFSPSFNDSAWGDAVETTPEKADWNKFYRREIPQWKDYGIKSYPSERREGDKVICALPYNCQFTPVLTVKAPSGKVIDIRTDCYHTGGPGGEPNVHAEYVTRDGEQTYESLGWMNGHEAIYTVPAGVEVVSLGYRETGYDCAFAGSFLCDNQDLNTLWKKSQRTLYVTMRDNYMDCPDRERGQWIGDVSNEMVETFYALSPSANLLTRKCAREFADWQKPDSVLFAPVPAGNWDRELPMQSMAFMGLGNWNYYLGSGDAATIKYVFPAAKRYMRKWKIQDNGLVEYRPGAWDWGDWGSDADMQSMCQEWFSITLQAYARQAELIGEVKEAKWADAAATKLNDAFRSKFWTGKGYRFDTYKERTDDRTQSLAVLSGIATPEQYPAIREIFRTTEFSSPYMERYVLEALCKMGYYQDALDRMQRRFKLMIDSPITTLWELFDTRELHGSYNHAWSGGPLIILSRYIAGVSPIKAGFETFQVKPELCNLKYVNTVVPTVRGNIKLDVNQASGYQMKLTVPRGTKAEVLLPEKYAKYSVNGRTRKPAIAKTDSTRRLLKLKEGTYTITAE